MQDLNSVYIPQQDKLLAIAEVAPANAIIICPECHSQKCKKNGLEHRQYGRVQRYKCNQCGYSFTNAGIYKRERYKENSISAEELGIQQNPSYRSVSVSLNKIYQPWLLEYVKKFIRFLASRNEFGTIVNQISYLNKFSRFVLDKHPDLEIEDLNREIVIEYLASLRNLNKAGTYIGTLRLFLDTGIANNWFKVPPYLITDEDYPKRFRPLPRYIPESVMQQLNKYIDDLPKPVMRMALVMQECGFRISELTTLRLNIIIGSSRKKRLNLYLLN
jgi:integrase/recombinase XerD